METSYSQIATDDGIRIRIESDGYPTGTRIFDSKGCEISDQVTAVAWAHEGADKIPYAVVTLGIMSVSLECNAVFKAPDGRIVSRIIYADGSEDHYHACRAKRPLVFRKKAEMAEFELLLACYRSGQMSERQWQEHLRDEAFRAWIDGQQRDKGRGAMDEPSPQQEPLSLTTAEKGEAAPRVRPLAWDRDDGEWWADTGLGHNLHYWIYPAAGHSKWILTLCSTILSIHDSSQEAQAAAQADFERRIRSALEEAPPAPSW